MGLQTGALPDFPWDTLAPFAERARAHPGGIVDLSVGTPVDPTPDGGARRAGGRGGLAGLPDDARHPRAAAGGRRLVRPPTRRARAGPGARCCRRSGSKELVAFLPSLLGLGAGDVVLHPSAAYPTYDVGARLAGATPEPTDDPVVAPRADATTCGSCG